MGISARMNTSGFTHALFSKISTYLSPPAPYREASPPGSLYTLQMAYRQTSFAPDEYYHCYSRGIDKRITFQDSTDYERFLQALYVCNDTESFNRDDLPKHSHASILSRQRTQPLVSVVAYCLMPNHYHIILHETAEGGITRFMQKLGTMYTMYFNAKNDRVGGLFVKPFRAKHIANDRYLQRVISYIHLNPVEIFEPGWKEGRVKNMNVLKSNLLSYRYSSLPEYEHTHRPESAILHVPLVRSLSDGHLPILSLINEAAEYYKGLR